MDKFLKIGFPVLCFVVAVSICVLMYAMHAKNDSNIFEEDVTELSAEEQQFINDNPSLYSEQTGSDADVNDETSSPSQLFIMNSDFFDDTKLPFFALSSFQGALEEYLLETTNMSTWHIYMSDYNYTDLEQTYTIRVDEIPGKAYLCTWDAISESFRFEEKF